MSAPHGELIESLRALVLGVKPSALPQGRISELKARGLVVKRAGRVCLTKRGHKLLAMDGDRAREEIFKWLATEEARRFFLD